MITVATERDVQRLVALGRSTYLAHFANIWSADGLQAYLDKQFDFEAITADIAGEQSRYLMVQHNRLLVGYAKLNFNRPIPINAARRGVELQKIYFLPEATGLGLGRQLIDRIVDDASDAGEENVWLDVLKSNEGGRRIYERSGFKVVGEMPFSTDKMQIDFWVMVHDLRR
jgi:diamine N-acetyltransferase